MRTFNLLENATVALAVFLTGIMAGFFYTYTFNVNRAMLQVDGSTYAVVQSLFNVTVRNPIFFACFFGAGAAAVLAALANVRHLSHWTFWVIAIAGALYILGVIVFTANVNLPLNAYTESWDPAGVPDDWETTRTAWNQANDIRVAASGSSFVLYLVAFVARASK